MTNGWEESSNAWIADMGENGDKGRQFILDPALLKLIKSEDYKSALDVGCGEGRMCRLLAKNGIKPIGIDPTLPLIEHARNLDNSNEYIKCFAENLPFEDNKFDLVLSCMSLIDIPVYKSAIKEMVRVLKPNGDLIIANLTAMNTAGSEFGWQKDECSKPKYYAIDNYMYEKSNWEEWRGIKIKNYHRPLSFYMKSFLDNNLSLKHFEEPIPIGGGDDFINHIKRMPWYVIMKWRKNEI
jgi:ubiquinone/menaquinone biosynthesis C-methylase UbiE